MQRCRGGKDVQRRRYRGETEEVQKWRCRSAEVQRYRYDGGAELLKRCREVQGEEAQRCRGAYLQLLAASCQLGATRGIFTSDMATECFSVVIMWSRLKTTPHYPLSGVLLGGRKFPIHS